MVNFTIAKMCINSAGLLGPNQLEVPEPSNLLQSGEISPPMSPTRILKESDNQWLNSEVFHSILTSKYVLILKSSGVGLLSEQFLGSLRISNEIISQWYKYRRFSYVPGRKFDARLYPCRKTK